MYLCKRGMKGTEEERGRREIIRLKEAVEKKGEEKKRGKETHKKKERKGT